MKQYKIFLPLFALIFIYSCSNKKEVKLSVDLSKENQSLNGQYSKISIEFNEATSSTIKYTNLDALGYAKKYAGINNNSCGIFNNDPKVDLSDCAHFIAHCLKDGGIEVKALDPNTSICKDGLCYRVVELTAALEVLSKMYTNIQEIDIKDAIQGDYGFFKIPAVRSTHAFMVCKPTANLDDITIYSHTTNRNCEKPEPKWYQFYDVSYRMIDSY